MTRLLITTFVFVLMMALPPQPLAQAEQPVQLGTGLSDLALFLHFDDAFADMQKMQLSTKPKILARSFPVDDPNAYFDLIAKIYDPKTVRAEFDQILQNAQISTATQKDAVTFYSDMTPFDLTWHEVLANRLYMFEPNEV